MDDKTKILSFAQYHFFTYGFSKSTMDEIAAGLKMSKKTIYKYFPSKDEIIKHVVKIFLSTHSKNLEEIVSSDTNAVHKFFLLMEYIGENLFKFSDKLLGDIQLYSPSLWKEVDKFRTEKMMINFGKIIEQGIKENYFIDQPSQIITTAFVSSIRGVINPEFLINSRFSARDALVITIEILMHGIMTSAGEKVFKKIKRGVEK
jgi:AcrR family transcriptional regulator